VAQVAGEHPEVFWWVPKSPVDSEESGEHPEMLWRLARTLGNRSSPVHGVAEQRAPEGSRVIKLPMNTRGCSLEAIRFRRHTGDA
jgi:hypothetical protein